MWSTGCHDTKVFWHIYRQRYVKILRNRPFSPQIIRKNLWFGFKTTNFTIHTIFLQRFFSHKFTQISTNNLLVESRWICVSFWNRSTQTHPTPQPPLDFPPSKERVGSVRSAWAQKHPQSEICVSLKHPQSGICVRLWKRGWDFFGEPFGNSQKKAIFVN